MREASKSATPPEAPRPPVAEGGGPLESATASTWIGSSGMFMENVLKGRKKELSVMRLQLQNSSKFDAPKGC